MNKNDWSDWQWWYISPKYVSIPDNYITCLWLAVIKSLPIHLILVTVYRPEPWIPDIKLNLVENTVAVARIDNIVCGAGMSPIKTVYQSLGKCDLNRGKNAIEKSDDLLSSQN